MVSKILKTCSRGHKFQGSGPCPVCWPGRLKKKEEIKNKTYTIKAKVWLYSGQTPWHFVNVSKKTSDEIKKKYGAFARGWGSLPVLVTIGKTNWKTSIFPDKKSDTYLLPLKADIRRKENIKSGDTITFVIEVRV